METKNKWRSHGKRFNDQELNDFVSEQWANMDPDLKAE